MKEVIFNKKEIIEINDQKIQELKQKALKNFSGKVRLCLHRNIRESLHEMIIVLCKNVYIRPHKHVMKTESFHVIEGSFLLIIFDKNGKEIKRILINKEQRKNNFLCRLNRNIWHMIIPVTDFVVFHEVTNGPYIRKGSSVFASWAPKEDDHNGIEKFIESILNSRKLKSNFKR